MIKTSREGPNVSTTCLQTKDTNAVESHGENSLDLASLLGESHSDEAPDLCPTLCEVEVHLYFIKPLRI